MGPGRALSIHRWVSGFPCTRGYLKPLIPFEIDHRIKNFHLCDLCLRRVKLLTCFLFTVTRTYSLLHIGRGRRKSRNFLNSKSNKKRDVFCTFFILLRIKNAVFNFFWFRIKKFFCNYTKIVKKSQL